MLNPLSSGVVAVVVAGATSDCVRNVRRSDLVQNERCVRVMEHLAAPFDQAVGFQLWEMDMVERYLNLLSDGGGTVVRCVP